MRYLSRLLLAVVLLCVTFAGNAQVIPGEPPLHAGPTTSDSFRSIIIDPTGAGSTVFANGPTLHNVVVPDTITAVASGNVRTPVSVLSDATDVSNSTLTDPTRITIAKQGNITVNATTGAMPKAMRGVHGRVSVGSLSTQNITTQGLTGVVAEATTDIGATSTVSAPFAALAVAASNPAPGVTVSSMYGIYGSTMGLAGGTTTNFAGLAFPQLSNATNTTQILLGTTTIPVGNFAVYDTTGYPSVLSGPVSAPVFQTSTALVTSTGGSTPAFGANFVGGTGGPATAAQNGWLKAQDSTGATVWIPVWK